MYESFYGLKNRPFVTVPSPDAYFPAAAIERARIGAERLIRRGAGPALVIGPVGTGKSLLCSVLARDLRREHRVAELVSTRVCTRRGFLQALLFELGLPYRGLDESELRLALSSHVTSKELCPRGLAVLVDEADRLPKVVLEELRAMTNLVIDNAPCVRPILFGGPALEEVFADPALESFNQRLAGRFYLEPFTYDETARYIQARMRCTDSSVDEVFTDQAIDAVHKASYGVPRLINQICEHAMMLGFVGQHRQLDADAIQEAWSDLQQLPAPHSQPPATDSAVIEFGSLDDADSEEHATEEQPDPEVHLDAIQSQLDALEDAFATTPASIDTTETTTETTQVLAETVAVSNSTEMVGADPADMDSFGVRWSEGELPDAAPHASADVPIDPVTQAAALFESQYSDVSDTHPDPAAASEPNETAAKMGGHSAEPATQPSASSHDAEFISFGELDALADPWQTEIINSWAFSDDHHATDEVLGHPESPWDGALANDAVRDDTWQTESGATAEHDTVELTSTQPEEVCAGEPGTREQFLPEVPTDGDEISSADSLSAQATAEVTVEPVSVVHGSRAFVEHPLAEAFDEEEWVVDRFSSPRSLSPPLTLMVEAPESRELGRQIDNLVALQAENTPGLAHQTGTGDAEPGNEVGTSSESGEELPADRQTEHDAARDWDVTLGPDDGVVVQESNDLFELLRQAEPADPAAGPLRASEPAPEASPSDIVADGHRSLSADTDSWNVYRETESDGADGESADEQPRLGVVRPDALEEPEGEWMAVAGESGSEAVSDSSTPAAQLEGAPHQEQERDAVALDQVAAPLAEQDPLTIHPPDETSAEESEGTDEVDPAWTTSVEGEPATSDNLLNAAQPPTSATPADTADQDADAGLLPSGPQNTTATADTQRIGKARQPGSLKWLFSSFGS